MCFLIAIALVYSESLYNKVDWLADIKVKVLLWLVFIRVTLCIFCGCHDCSIAAFIIVVCSIKMFRSAFTNPSHQFLIVVFTMLFFRYDYAELSESFLVDYFFISILLNKASWTISIWNLQSIWITFFICICICAWKTNILLFSFCSFIHSVIVAVMCNPVWWWWANLL